MNKNACFFGLILFCTVGQLQAQKPETGLVAPENWRSEVLTFPLEFAPEINLSGFEDVLFAPGWNKKESEQFWMYHFTWFLDTKEPMTVDFLEKNMKLYYEGLASAVLKGDTDSNALEQDIEAVCLFVKTDKGFLGKLNVYDPFFTKDTIVLNMKVGESFCQKTKKHVVSFDISPRPVSDSVWQFFDAIMLREPCN